jgi:hypothetical protein
MQRGVFCGGGQPFTFSTKEEYDAFLAAEGKMPRGFRCGTSWISFTPVEANFPSRMNVTLITLDVRTLALDRLRLSQ